MALRMVALNRAADGRWFARKGIPQDVRKEYAQLYGVSREAHLKLPADTTRHEAKARLGEWEAEVETRIATLRAERNGQTTANHPRGSEGGEDPQGACRGSEVQRRTAAHRGDRHCAGVETQTIGSRSQDRTPTSV
jgi:hypothetical protein